MATVLVPLAEGFEEIEAVSLIDIMRRGGIEVMVRSLGEELEVTGANGIVVKAEDTIYDITVDQIDMVVLPGGWGGTNLLAEDENVQSLLKAMDAKGKDIGAMCAAPFALNAAGVLKHNYTCYPSVEEQIRLEGYQGDKKQVVQDGNVMTSRGPGTAICFALQIIKRLVGEEAYAQVREGVLATYCE
jgi:4-methyl-5(b-hydroxyethyl)-thiazole monophosphate biosynthesis